MTILSEGPVEADPISVDAYYIDLVIAAQVLLVTVDNPSIVCK
jgi:hypothetical protein